MPESVPEDVPKASNRVALAASGQPTEAEEYCLVRKDGGRVQVEIRSFPIEIDGQRLMLGCIRDITARKKAERERGHRHRRIQRLQAAVLRLAMHPALVEGDLTRTAQGLTESATAALHVDRIGVWLLNSSGDELHSVDEFSVGANSHSDGAVISYRACPAYFDALKHGLALDAADGLRDSRTCEIALARGNAPAASVLDCPIRISGKVVGVVRYQHFGPGERAWEPEEIRFAAEISDQMAQVLLNADRRRAEEALKKSQASLDRAQRMASLGNWELDCDTGDVVWSSEMYSIFGLAPQTHTPTHERFLKSVHPDDRQRVENAVRDILRTGAPYAVDFRVVRPDGSMRHVRERAELETDSTGSTLRMIGTLQDITEYKRLEERFQTAQKLESVGRLAGGVAHDFNNLLTVINGYTGLLLRRAGHDNVTRVGLEEIRKAGDKAAMLTQQLLAFSRKQVVQPRVLDLNVVVSDTHRMLRRLIGENIELTTILDANLARVKADPGQMNQILMNLSVNARDAMPEGGRLIIETANFDVQKSYAEEDRLPGAGFLRAARRERYRRGHGRRDSQPHLRTVLHHQGTRPRHRARHVHRLRNCRAVRRVDLGLQRARTRNHHKGLSSAFRK